MYNKKRKCTLQINHKTFYDDLLYEVLTFLDWKDLNMFTGVSKRFKNIIENRVIPLILKDQLKKNHVLNKVLSKVISYKNSKLCSVCDIHEKTHFYCDGDCQKISSNEICCDGSNSEDCFRCKNTYCLKCSEDLTSCSHNGEYYCKSCFQDHVNECKACDEYYFNGYC